MVKKKTAEPLPKSFGYPHFFLSGFSLNAL